MRVEGRGNTKGLFGRVGIGELNGIDGLFLPNSKKGKLELRDGIEGVFLFSQFQWEAGIEIALEKE